MRGSVFYDDECGFASGEEGLENAMRYSVVGATKHPEVDYENYEYTEGPWAANPTETVNYVSCHDNMTLWDKLSVSCPKDSEDILLAKNRLSAAIVFTAQGIPFFLSGEEFARTKPVEGSDKPAENSYNLPFYTNSIKYDRTKQYEKLLEYYKGLIAFRKVHAGLRMADTKDVVKALHFVPVTQKNAVAFTITTEEECIFVAYNANKKDITIELPEEGTFEVYIAGEKAGNESLGNITGQAKVAGISCLTAVKKLA